MGEGELKKRSMTLEYIKDLDEHLILDGTERYVEVGNIGEAKKDFPLKDIAVADYSKAKDFVESKKILLKLQKWYLKWFGDSS